MNRLLITLALTSMLLVQDPNVHAQRQEPKPAKPFAASVLTQRSTKLITADQLRDYLTFIASDEMEGRDTPSRGLDTVARFLAMNLSRWGFKPAGDSGSYFQKIALRRQRIDPEKTRAEVNGRVLTLGEDYIPGSAAGSVTGSLVFAGNGWLIKARNVDAYKNINARGKIAVVFGAPNSFPRSLRRSDLDGKPGEDWMGVSEYATRQGVIGLIHVPDFQYIAFWNRARQRMFERGSLGVEKFQTEATPRIPWITVSPEFANSLFQSEQQQATALFEQVTRAEQIPAFELKPEKKFSINIAVDNENLATQNVVAIWEGSDPVLKNEYVALGAHYDHVGVSSQQRDDKIFNGADDDGSGTTALLAMAEALSRASVRPKRSVLFVWHAGEEKGLWGSRYFTEYPTVPLDHIVAQINLDMIGRSKQTGDNDPRNRELSAPNEIYVIGSKLMSTELGDLTATVNRSFLNLTYDYRYDDPNDPNRFFSRSDHYNYARKGVPIIFFFDGVHQDYHQPGDSADKIDYQKMEKVTQTIYMTLWEVANKAARPKVDKQLPAELTRE
jgi:hypothetical protein